MGYYELIEVSKGVFFNIDRYHDAMKLRKSRGETFPSKNINLIDHPLCNKKLLRKKDNKIYNIEQVLKHWYCGWYYAMVIENNNSHCLIMWEDINCASDIILNNIREAQEEYELIGEK